MRRLLVSLALAACGGGANAPATTPAAASASPGGANAAGANPGGASPTPAPKMSSFDLNGYTLTGAEYWPYAGTTDIDYPTDVLWGFYPEQGVVPPGETDPNPATARPEAVACAGRAFEALRAFLATDPPALRRIVERGQAAGTMVPRFYLWTNDYGRAADPFPPGRREARLWWWQRKTPEAGKPPGYWKWESVVTQSGECIVPHQPQIDAYLSDMLATLERPAAPPAR